MKPKGLRVIRKGAVLEGELPKALQRQGPKWLKSWPRIRLNSEADARRCARSAAGSAHRGAANWWVSKS
jgi:hypothetical protein